jgi:predicted dinucleotide-binding enzyme
VVKAFNTIFRDVLARVRPLEVFIAGDNVHAKAAWRGSSRVSGCAPMDVGGLKIAHWLEGTGVVPMGLARHAVGNIDFALGVTLPG